MSEYDLSRRAAEISSFASALRVVFRDAPWEYVEPRAAQSWFGSFEEPWATVSSDVHAAWMIASCRS